MPIRDVDTFFETQSKPFRMMANRGANGIDGVVSTALGTYAALKQPVTLVIGDLSFYHDMNGLLAAKLMDIPLTVVLINNDGEVSFLSFRRRLMNRIMKSSSVRRQD